MWSVIAYRTISKSCLVTICVTLCVGRLYYIIMAMVGWADGPLSSLQVERIGGELVGGKFGLSQWHVSTVGTGRNSYCHDFKFLPQQLNNIKEYSQQDATHI